VLSVFPSLATEHDCMWRATMTDEPNLPAIFSNFSNIRDCQGALPTTTASEREQTSRESLKCLSLCCVFRPALDRLPELQINARVQMCLGLPLILDFLLLGILMLGLQILFLWIL
jgi:hypothetical protein